MWYHDYIGMRVHGYGILMDNQIRVCTAACQDPILYPLKLEVECHCRAKMQLWVAFNCQHS